MVRKPIDRFRVRSMLRPRIHLRFGRTTHTLIEKSSGIGGEQTTSATDLETDSGASTDVASPTPIPLYSLSSDPLNQTVYRQIRAQVLRGVRLLAAPLLWLGFLAFLGGTGVSAFLWLTTLPPLPNCNRLHPLLSSDTDQLYCAEQAARSGKLEAMISGLALIKSWPPDHPLHNRAKRLVQDWSRVVLLSARTKAEKNDLAGAIALAQEIPSVSPSYKPAQLAIAIWRKDRNYSQVIDDTFKVALKAQDWKAAEEQLRALAKLRGTFWLQTLNQMRQQLLIEKSAQKQLQRVRQLSGQAETPDALGQVITLADQIAPNSYARPAAEAELTRLSQTLLNQVQDRLAVADWAGAIALARWFPRSIPLSQTARDVLWFSQAQPLVAEKIPPAPLYQRLWQLWLVLPPLRQIQPVSAVHPQAQVLIPQLDRQMQDLTQLQLAQAAANLRQIPTFHLAIVLAQTITVDRPQRVYAQTLIAQWRKDIQRLEDRPYLVRARQLAKTPSLPNLKAAIVQARQVQLGRPLRGEAQAAIAQWTRQVQTIEDRPILQRAQALAKQQKLREAVQVANKIRSNRALYRDAQAAVQNWTTQIQIAEDRPLLNEAYGLAEQGSLSSAIAVADRIAPGRALYDEAQAAIARWESQRSDRYEPEELEEDTDDSPEPDDSDEPVYGPWGRRPRSPFIDDPSSELPPP